MSDLVRMLAFAFQRKGSDDIERAKLLHMVAFDLRWLSPDQTKRAVARAIEVGLLREEGDRLRPSFDPRAVDIPLNFRPAENVADQEVALDEVPPAPGAPPDESVAERERRGGLVDLEVARLLVARRRGEDVRERAAELERARLSS